MKEKEIAFSFINRIGLENLRNNELVDSINKYLLNPEVKSNNSSHIPTTSTFQTQSDNYKSPQKKLTFKEDSFKYNNENLQNNKPVQVQILEHLVNIRNQCSGNTQDSSFNEDFKSKSLLVSARKCLVEVKRNSSWYLLLDDKSETDVENTFVGIDKLFSLVLVLRRLEKYTNSESAVIPFLANNILFSFRYTFQSETSNLSVVQHPEWAIEYMKECVKKYVKVFKKAKNDLKLDSTSYFKALVPEPYSGDLNLLEEFSLVTTECTVDEVLSGLCLLLAKEARLFVYSRLPFLVYEYFLQNQYNSLGLTELTKLLSKPKNSTVLEVSRSTFRDDKVTSVIYALLSAMVDFGLYLRSLDQNSTFELFSDFDNNTLVPFIMIHLYHYSDEQNLNGVKTNTSRDTSNSNRDNKENNNNDDKDTEKKEKEIKEKEEKEKKTESKITLCFESNILFGCLDALLEMESVHVMKISKRVLSVESFSDSIGVRTGLNATMYLQDDQFFSQVTNVLVSLLNMVDRRCQCLKFVESRRKYVAKVVVPMLEHFVDSVKHIWNSLDSVLESCTIACLLLESTTVLYEFLLRYPLTEFMQETVASVDTISQKMVSIFDQYFVELYYDQFKNIHRHSLEVLGQITDKLLQLCALCSYKNYNKILRNALGSMEKLLVSILIPNKPIDFIFENEEEVETALGNCQYLLQCVRKLVEVKEFPDTMQQLQDMVVILSMETVELKTSAEYLNLLGTSRISGKNTIMNGNNKETQTNQMGKMNTTDSFVSSVIFDDFEGDFGDDVHDSLIVSKIKQKLKIKKLSLSQTYTLINHILSATGSDDLPLKEVEISKEVASIAKKAYNTLFNLEKLNNVLFSEQPTQADSDYTYSDVDMDVDSQMNSSRSNPTYAHLSLCKPLYLRKQFIDGFVEKLKNTLQNLKPFYLQLENQVSICANDNLNRYFAVSFVDKVCRDNTVLPIIDLVDQVMDSFGFDKYYEQRKPHVSFASTRDLSLILSQLYKACDPSGNAHSSNYWTNLEQFLEKCDNLPQEFDNYYDATSVNYTFNFPTRDMEDTNFNKENKDEKISLYVDEIHILVGSRDHVIKLT